MLCGHGPAITASGKCTQIMYAGWTEHPRSNRRGRPTNGVSDCLPPSWTAGPREELVPRIPDIFSCFFLCSKNIHECATLYLVNEIEFSNYDAGFVIPTPKLPLSEQTDPSTETRGNLRAIPAVCVFANSPIRRLISTNLVETRALRTFFFFFFTENHHYGKVWWDEIFKDRGGWGKVVPPPKKISALARNPILRSISSWVTHRRRVALDDASCITHTLERTSHNLGTYILVPGKQLINTSTNTCDLHTNIYTSYIHIPW